jgi:hypothetical protein
MKKRMKWTKKKLTKYFCMLGMGESASKKAAAEAYKNMNKKFK